MGKIPKKSTRILAYSEELGKLQAREKIRHINHKFSKESLLVSARDHIGKLIDNTSVRDWVYVFSFLSAVYIAYQILSKTEIAFVDFMTGLGGGLLGFIIWKIFPEPIEELKIVINQTLLAQSIVIAYGVLKLDLGDVTSAVTKLVPAIKSLASLVV